MNKAGILNTIIVGTNGISTKCPTIPITKSIVKSCRKNIPTNNLILLLQSFLLNTIFVSADLNLLILVFRTIG